MCLRVCTIFFFCLAFDHTYVCVCVFSYSRPWGCPIYFKPNGWTQVDRVLPSCIHSTTRFKQFPPSFSFLFHKSVREREKNKKMERERRRRKKGFSLEEKAKMKDDDHLSICPLRLPGFTSLFFLELLHHHHHQLFSFSCCWRRRAFSTKSLCAHPFWTLDYKLAVMASFFRVGGSCRMVMVRTHLPEATPAETLFSSPVNSPLHLFCQRLWFSLSVRGFHSTAAVRFVTIMVAVVSSFPFVSVLSLIRPKRY